MKHELQIKAVGNGYIITRSNNSQYVAEDAQKALEQLRFLLNRTLESMKHGEIANIFVTIEIS